jgi:undecaprenyl-diphosphatase
MVPRLPPNRRALLACLVIVASAGAFIFLQLTSEIAEGETHRFDEAILLAFRTADNPALPLGPKWLTSTFIEFTALGSTSVLGLVTLLVIGFLLSERKRFHALLIGLAVAGGALISTILKMLVGRPRPESVSHLVDVTTLSFPSGHAMLSAVTYLTLGALLMREFKTKRTRILVIFSVVLLTALVGVSRVYLGVHYPTDVLGGWCAGAAWAAFCLLVVDFLEARSAKNMRG